MLDKESIEKAALIKWPDARRYAAAYKWGWVLYTKDCSEVYTVAEVDGQIIFTKKN